jgi:hypothetical protein
MERLEWSMARKEQRQKKGKKVIWATSKQTE